MLYEVSEDADGENTELFLVMKNLSEYARKRKSKARKDFGSLLASAYTFTAGGEPFNDLLKQEYEDDTSTELEEFLWLFSNCCYSKYSSLQLQR